MRFELKAMTPAGRVESLALQASNEASARASGDTRLKFSLPLVEAIDTLAARKSGGP
jgi:hypothetical protein